MTTKSVHAHCIKTLLHCKNSHKKCKFFIVVVKGQPCSFVAYSYALVERGRLVAVVLVLTGMLWQSCSPQLPCGTLRARDDLGLQASLWHGRYR